MSGRDALGIFNIIIVLGILGGISYLAMSLQPEEYDRDTLCVVGITPPHRVVIIDKTDLYSMDQAEAIAGVILNERDRLGVGERLSLFELNENGNLSDTNNFSLCNPGSGEQVNPLYRNPERIQARYEALFAGPLQTALSDLVTPKDAPQSPILEALAGLTHEDSFDRSVPGRHIVLVSDMLQNSEIFTVYGRGRGSIEERLPDPVEVAQALEAQHGDGLMGVTLEIRLIPRVGWEADQAGTLRDYWDLVFRQLGVRAYWSELPGGGGAVG